MSSGAETPEADSQELCLWPYLLPLNEVLESSPVPTTVKYFVTNFIQSYLYQIFDDSHGFKASLKPLKKPFDRCQSRLEAINNG